MPNHLVSEHRFLLSNDSRRLTPMTSSNEGKPSETLLNADTLRILLGNSNSRKKQAVRATQQLISTILKEELDGTRTIELQNSLKQKEKRAKKRKKKANSNTEDIADRSRPAALALLASNNLFDYAAVAGISQFELKILESTYYSAKSQADIKVRDALQCIQNVIGISEAVSSTQVLLIVDSCPIDFAMELLDTFPSLSKHENGSADLRAIEDFLRTLNFISRLSKALGDGYGFVKYWRNSSISSYQMSRTWNGADGKNDKIQSMSQTSTNLNNSHLPPVRINRPEKSKNGRKGKQSVEIDGARSQTDQLMWSSSDKVDVRQLRRELEASTSDVQRFTQLVDHNIAWVQSNCDMSAYSSTLSSRTKRKCQVMATERLLSVFVSDNSRTLSWALHRWRSSIRFEYCRQCSIRYCKIKCIHSLALTLSQSYSRCLARYWNIWLNNVRIEIRLERDAAAIYIQCLVRKHQSKVRVAEVRLGKTALVIQNLFRRIKAVGVVKKKANERVNLFAAMAIQKLFKRLFAIRRAKAEAQRRKQMKSIVKIQKVFRGMKGREKFTEIKEVQLQSLPTTVKDDESLPLAVSDGMDLDALSRRVISPSPPKPQVAAVGSRKTTAPVKKVKPPTIQGVKKNSPSKSSQKLPAKSPAKSRAITLPVDSVAVKAIVRTKSPSPPASPPSSKSRPSSSRPSSPQQHRKVQTAEIEIQTDCIWSEAPLAGGQPAMSPNYNAISETSLSPSVTVHEKQSQAVKSVSNSRQSGEASNAAVLIQKIARGKLARGQPPVDSLPATEPKSKPKIGRSSPPRASRPISSEKSKAATAIQKIARGKMARVASSKLAIDIEPSSVQDSSNINVIVPEPASDSPAKPLSEPVNSDLWPLSAAGDGPLLNSISKSDIEMATKSNDIPVVDDSLTVEKVIEMDHHMEDFHHFSLEHGGGNTARQPSETLMCSQQTVDAHAPLSVKSTSVKDVPAVTSHTIDQEKLIHSMEHSSPVSTSDQEKTILSMGNSSPVSTSPTANTHSRPPSTGGLFSNFASNIRDASKSIMNRLSHSPTRPSTTSAVSGGSLLTDSAISKPHTAPAGSDLAKQISVCNDMAANGVEKSIEIELSVKCHVQESLSTNYVAEAAIIDGNHDQLTKDSAALRIQLLIRRKLAKIKVKRQLNRVIKCQVQVALLVSWGATSIQRIFRGRKGRKKFRNRLDDQTRVLRQRQFNSAIILQCMVRAFLARRKVRARRSVVIAQQKQVNWLKSLQKKELDTSHQKQESDVSQPARNSDPLKDEKSHRQNTIPVIATDSESNNHSRASDDKLRAIDEKLQMLQDFEKRIKESEEKMRLEAQKAEERMKEQLRLLEERTQQVEAERLAREELMKLAVGQLSHRSPFATAASNSNPSTTRTTSTTAPPPKSAFSTTSSIPPTARSARENPIPSSAPRILHEGLEWVQLWDAEQHANYWWCDASQTAQWEQPGQSIDDVQEESDAMSDSGYESTGGMTDYSTDIDSSYRTDTELDDLDGWQEYWDEQAQAKYWYNNNTGEASWTLPDQLHSRRSSTAGQTAVAAPSYGNGWTSYVDDQTGQLYWHNINTGEVQWDA